jgi:hypothetical protein
MNWGMLAMKRLLGAICLLGAAVLYASVADAATVLVVETESYLSGATGGTATVYLDGKSIRIDSNEGGTDFSIIYGIHGGRLTYLLINNRDKSYYEIDRDAMLKTRQDLEKQIETQRRQIAQLPPQQRSHMEKTLQQNMARMGFAETRINYSIVSRGIKIGEWICNHYQGEREGTKVEEVWASKPAEMGIGKSDLKVLGEMAEYFESTGQDMPAFFSFSRDGADHKDDGATYEGFPVIVVTYVDGKRREKSQIKEVKQETLAENFFELPEGLRKLETGK